MPTYEYLCQACGYRFDKFQNIKDEPIKKCPKCNEEQVSRLLTGGSGLIFKGSGFYITDYKNNSNKEKTPKPESDTKKEKPAEKTVNKE